MTVTSYKVPINHEVLRWARESIHIDIKNAAKVASVKANIYALEFLEIKLKHYPRIVDMLFQ